MQRPQSLEFKNANIGQPNRMIPPMISYKKKTETPTSMKWSMSVMPTLELNQHFVQPIPNSLNKINNIENRFSNRVVNLDQQVSQLNRISNHRQITNSQRYYSGLLQSQSFNQNISKSSGNANLHRSVTGDNNQSSRLIVSTYMSPPPSNWTTVGNIIPVKRSTSMPGYRSMCSNLSKTCQNSIQTQIVTKKKSGPFHCLKHSIKKSGIKLESITPKANKPSKSPRRSSQIPTLMSISSQFPKQNSEKIKTSRSLFKKKSPSSSSSCQASNLKARGIKKSISLFFSSKSYKTSKSDPSNLDQSTISDQNDTMLSGASTIQREFSFKSATRLNHSYESMLHGEDKACSMSLYTDTNRRNSYNSVEDNSSLSYSHSISPMEKIVRARTPSDSSLPDTASLSSKSHDIYIHNNQNKCSADQHSITVTNFQACNNYRPINSSCWKTVVGNVCRSNSKDSAIANSTLSADVMISQSKRMSQISTMSRTSDITQTSEDFNDSSYSSFNDLAIHASQIYHKRKRIKSIIPKLEPIELESRQQESSNSYDSSPFSDSSTETLRPLSCLLRRRFLSSNNDNRPFHSNTLIKQTIYSDSSEYIKPNCLKHSHSWPSCNYPSLCKSISSPKVCVKPSKEKQNITNTLVALKMECYPQLKFDILNNSRVNNSPLLSQYSRLYSLKSVGIHSQSGLSNVSGQITSSIQPPQLSPIKYSSRTYQHFPS